MGIYVDGGEWLLVECWVFGFIKVGLDGMGWVFWLFVIIFEEVVFFDVVFIGCIYCKEIVWCNFWGGLIGILMWGGCDGGGWWDDRVGWDCRDSLVVGFIRICCLVISCLDIELDDVDVLDWVGFVFCFAFLIFCDCLVGLIVVCFCEIGEFCNGFVGGLFFFDFFFDFFVFLDFLFGVELVCRNVDLIKCWFFFCFSLLLLFLDVVVVFV